MTKVVYTTLAVVLGGLQLTGCKKEKADDTGTIADKNKGHIVCIADGKEWISDAPTKLHKVVVYDTFINYTREVYGTRAFVFGDTLYFSGAKVSGTDSTGMDFTVVLTTERVGIYNIGAYPPTKAGQAAACYYEKLSGRELQQGYNAYNSSGVFEVTGFSDSLKIVSGKFHFDMVPLNSGNPKTPVHQVKNGVFTDVKLD